MSWGFEDSWALGLAAAGSSCLAVIAVLLAAEPSSPGWFGSWSNVSPVLAFLS